MSDFTAQSRHILSKVLQGRLSKSEAARLIGVSRKTVYSLLKSHKKKLIRDKRIEPRVSRDFFRADILHIVSNNPFLGPLKISSELRKIRKDLSVRSVWLVLKDLNLDSKEKRLEYSSNFKRREKLDTQRRYIKVTPEARRRMVEGVIFEGKKVKDVTGYYGISRKTFAKWKKRYLKAKEEGLNLLQAVSDNYPQGAQHPRGANQSVVNKVLDVVISKPYLSSQRIASELGFIGNHGVQNILARLNASHYTQRLDISERALRAIPTPVTRPAVEPILAPEGVRLPFIPRWQFIKTFIFTSILSFASIYSLLWWINLISGEALSHVLGTVFASVALLMGSVFFLYSLKYYLSLAIVLSFSQSESAEGIGHRAKGKRNIFSWILGLGNGRINGKWKMENGKSGPVGLTPNLEHIVVKRHPKISVHIPLYNEKKVVERILNAVTSFDYPGDYEVIIADDSTDETTEIVKQFLKVNYGELRFIKENDGTEIYKTPLTPNKPSLTLIHRSNRSGFKGGALRLALSVTDPEVEFVSVFDADFVPYPDTLELFLKYFQVTAGTLSFGQTRMKANDSRILANDIRSDSRIAAVQGYQWHVLNKSENWITRGVRSEYAGSYVIERSGAEIYSGIKQISGAVYMIRRDVLEEIGWETSITEDFQLTLKLYEKGYKVVYTPYIQAPAECVSTLKRLIRQRMRWAEGHSNNIRRMFGRLMFGRWEETLSNSKLVNSNSGKTPITNYDLPITKERRFVKSPLTLSEKLEFLYLSPYYLQSFFFLIGTFSWLISETVFAARLPFWTSLWGWSLVLTNFLSLPLMNAVGLFLEESEEKDYLGLTSFAILSYILVPFQAYAAVKGFIQKQEGPWFRTPKTGRITDIITRGRFYRLIAGILPGRAAPAVSPMEANAKLMKANKLMDNSLIRSNSLSISSYSRYVALATANSRFDSFKIRPKRIRWYGKLALIFVLTTSLLIHSLAFRAEPVEATWYDTGYLYRKKLTIDNTLVSGSANHSNFPILVSYTDASLKTTANGGRVTNSSGFDIIFTDDDKTTKLDHEIERYTATTGEIFMWVRIPTLPYNVDKDIYIYYGNSSISTSQENVAGVWDVNYVDVLHLKESPTGTLNELNDSSGSGNHGQTFSMGASNSVDAKAGKGLNFVRADAGDQIRLYDSVSLDDTADEGTLQYWVNFVAAPPPSTYYLIMVHSQRFSASRGMEHAYNSTANFFLYTNAADGAWFGLNPGPFTAGQWHFVTWRWKLPATKEVALFVDGTQQTLTNNPLSSWINAATIDDWYFGGIVDRNDRWFDGKLDEVRVSNVARPAGWITTEYNNQNNQGTGTGKFIKTLGGEEQIPEMIVLLLPLAFLVPYFVKSIERRRRMYLKS